MNETSHSGPGRQPQWTSPCLDARSRSGTPPTARGARRLRGALLTEASSPRGVATSREAVGEFELGAQGRHRRHERHRGRPRPRTPVLADRLGTRPSRVITGVPAYVDGRMLDISAAAGIRLVNRDRMWHYTEGIRNWDPIRPTHGIRILPGPSSTWFDALGRHLSWPCLPLAHGGELPSARTCLAEIAPRATAPGCGHRPGPAGARIGGMTDVRRPAARP
ncbi:FAD-binding protein [Streptomyces sp. NBC_00893]|uniref:FAD-binding protein n=1 Tax=Streptomyces sp. NBC_00893 TaxID=2975862 RepID=UPI0022556EEF|nr:FAD-binding protein [Streptomyces sp. NBC_00893]MCX4851241.1 FAD-binding protein [Streptomyces sp. NBC_00893]